MQSNVRIMLAALGVVVVVASGCANNDVVKKEEPIAPQTTKAKAGPVAGTSQARPSTNETKHEQMKSVEAKGARASANTAFESAYFDFDKANLSPAARDVLTKNANTLIKVSRDAKVRIEGNCDERGSAEYNLALGERRAKSALQYLITLGVPTERLSVISYGKEHPADPGHDESAWAKNRRDDFVVQK